MEKTVKQFLNLYGVGTRIMTPHGPGTCRAIYDHQCLIMIDAEYRRKAKGRPGHRMPYPELHWTHDERQNYHGEIYNFEDIKLMLRSWSSLRPEEVESIGWDNQSCNWASKSRKGIIKFVDDRPACLRPDEYTFFCALRIDLFELIKDKIAVEYED